MTFQIPVLFGFGDDFKTYLFEMQSQRGETEIFHPLIHFAKGYSDQSHWPRLPSRKQGPRNPGHLPLLFQYHKQEAG